MLDKSYFVSSNRQAHKYLSPMHFADLPVEVLL